MMHVLVRSFLFLWLLALAGAAGPALAQERASQPTGAPDGELVIYTRTGCPYCDEAKEFLARAAEQVPGFRYTERNIAEDPAALEAFLAEVEKHGIERPGVPLMVAGDGLVMGWRMPDSPSHIASLLGWPAGDWRRWVEGPMEAAIPDWLSLDRFGLPAFTVILGLLDGFNPCAMWVLMFLLSMLVHVKSRRRMFLIAGIFVLVSGLVYFLFMVAWLNLSLAFRWSNWLRLAIGMLGLTAALFHLKDFFLGLQGPSLSIPEEGKSRIGQRVRAIVTARNLPLALAAVTVLAILVNFYELLCTAGLPALYTQVLARQEISGAAFYGYLALYNLAYIFDDGLMVFAATWALSSRRLTAGGGRILKGVSGLLLLVLSLILMWRPEWLSFN